MKYVGLLMVGLAGPFCVAVGLTFPEALAIIALSLGGQTIWLLCPSNGKATNGGEHG